MFIAIVTGLAQSGTELLENHMQTNFITFSTFINLKDSPRGEADGQSFIFPPIVDDTHSIHISRENERRDSSFCDQLHAVDSGIDSIQASPSPNALVCLPGIAPQTISSPCQTPTGSPTPSISSCNKLRRPSSALLHPDHARLLALRTQQISPDQSSIEDMTEFISNGVSGNIATGSGLQQQLCTASSSTTSSMTSIAGISVQNQRYEMSQCSFQDPTLICLLMF